MKNEEIKKAIEEKKEKISKMSEDELEKASAGINYVEMYQEACESFIPSPVLLSGKFPKQCVYCGYSSLAPGSGSKYYCFKDLIK